jgi:hypothetical protein
MDIKKLREAIGEDDGVLVTMRRSEEGTWEGGSVVFLGSGGGDESQMLVAQTRGLVEALEVSLKRLKDGNAVSGLIRLIVIANVLAMIKREFYSEE